MDKYKFSFDSNNSNSIIIRNADNRIIKMIACPPIENGIDIITIDNNLLNKGYNYNFNGFIIITTKRTRKLYCEGKLLAKTNRNIIFIK